MSVSVIFCLLLELLILSTCISIKGDRCFKFDKCQTKPHEQTCSCTANCAVYGTCCQDFPKLSNTTSKQSFHCYFQKTQQPIYAKRSCVDGYLGHIGIAAACVDIDVDDMDIGNNHIVTSYKSKITYWNRHCALCNNEDEKDLEEWNIAVLCPAKDGVDRRLIRKNLTYFEDAKGWGLKIEGEFVRCIVKYAPPSYLDKVERCRPNLISSCPEDYTNEQVVTKCSKYYGERRLKNSNKYFRNVHCAICNGFGLKDLECSSTSQPDDYANEADFGDVVEDVFTKGRWLDKEEGKRFQCSEGFLYDPFWKNCRRFKFKELPLPSVAVNSAHSSRLAILVLISFTLFF